MELRWTEEAVTDLERITDYLFQNAPERAADLVDAIYNAPSGLLAFPYRGRPGKKQGTRELVLSPLPYMVVYQISGDFIHIVRILHGAQKWP
ncbi:MAG TPA: type II toxin-antitoxin system RelE/ParE family toxin [Terriglobia bacterium]|nr:type II toxin-antitoxin system RelE/ParE family toxin [Terriglobia bacterium]